jgi:hypothetical protein
MLKRTPRPRYPEGAGVLKNSVPVEEGPGRNRGGGVVGTSRYAACRFQEQVPHSLRHRGVMRLP